MRSPCETTPNAGLETRHCQRVKDVDRTPTKKLDEVVLGREARPTAETQYRRGWRNVSIETDAAHHWKPSMVELCRERIDGLWPSSWLKRATTHRFVGRDKLDAAFQLLPPRVEFAQFTFERFKMRLLLCDPCAFRPDKCCARHRHKHRGLRGSQAPSATRLRWVNTRV